MRPMSRPTPQQAAMQRALSSCGGEAPLAKALGVSVAELSLWLRGREDLPVSVYCKALEMTAGRRRKSPA